MEKDWKFCQALSAFNCWYYCDPKSARDLVRLFGIFESYSNKGETTVHAKSNVEFFNTDLIGKCDSLYYSSYDSSITLYDEPIIWIDEYQIFSDTISSLLLLVISKTFAPLAITSCIFDIVFL